MMIEKVLEKFAKENGLNIESGGGFKAETEDYEYAKGSEGVLLHDGGDFAPYINMDYQCYSMCEKFDRFLEMHGYWHEPATSWYTSFYRL